MRGVGEKRRRRSRLAHWVWTCCLPERRRVARTVRRRGCGTRYSTIGLVRLNKRAGSRCVLLLAAPNSAGRCSSRRRTARNSLCGPGPLQKVANKRVKKFSWRGMNDVSVSYSFVPHETRTNLLSAARRSTPSIPAHRAAGQPGESQGLCAVKCRQGWPALLATSGLPRGKRRASPPWRNHVRQRSQSPVLRYFRIKCNKSQVSAKRGILAISTELFKTYATSESTMR